MTTPLRRLGELAEIQTGLPVRRLVTRKGGGGSLVFALTPASLPTDSQIHPDENTLVPSIANLTPEAHHHVQPGDIYVTAKSTVGSMRCAMIDPEWTGDLTPCFASSLIRIHVRPNEQVVPRYLHAWLGSSDGKAALFGESQSATSQLNLTGTSVSEVRVPIPPIEQQRKIVALLEHAESAHRCATAAADTRLQIAREIAFRPQSHE